MSRLSAARRAVRRRPGRFAWFKPRHAIIAGIGLFACVTIGGGAVWALRADLPERAMIAVEDFGAGILKSTARAGLGVREIVVTGREHTRRADVIAALDVREGTPMLRFSSAKARSELERLPWVGQAEVERRFPNAIVVRLTERVPLALWQVQGRFAVIDGDGREIKGIDPGAFAHLPMVVGDDAAKHAAGLLALLATEPDLMNRVTAAVRVSGRRWDLVLDREIRILLPEQDIGAAWVKLGEAERQDRLLSRAVTHVDLRAPDRMTLRTIATAEPPPPGAATARTRPPVRTN